MTLDLSQNPTVSTIFNPPSPKVDPSTIFPSNGTQGPNQGITIPKTPIGDSTFPSIGGNAPISISTSTQVPTPPPVPTTITGENTTPKTPISLPITTSTPSPIPTALMANAPVPPIGQIPDPTTGQIPPPPPQNNPPATPSPFTQTTGQIQQLIDQLGGRGAFTTDQYNQQQIDLKTQRQIQAYNDYQYAKTDQANRLENIRTTEGGTKEGIAQQMSSVQAETDAHLSNLAYQSAVATGNLTAAQNIMDAKIKNQYQPIMDQADYLIKFVQANNADLTDKEKTLLANQAFQLHTNYDQLTTANADAHKFLADNGLFTPAIGYQLDHANNLNDIAQIKQNAVSGTSGGGTSTVSAPSTSNGQPIKLPDGTQITNPISISKVSSIPQQFQQYVAGGPQGLVYVDATRYTDANTQVKNQIQTAANKAGVPVLDANGVAGVQALDVTFKSLDSMSQLASTVLSPGVWGQIKGMTINQINQKFGTGGKVTDPITGQSVPVGALLNSFDQYRDSAIKAVTALAGGAGSGLRLNTGTIETAANNLPTSKDSLEYAQTKIATFKSLLTRQLSEKFPEIKPENQGSTKSSGSLPIVQTKVGAINPNF